MEKIISNKILNCSNCGIKIKIGDEYYVIRGCGNLCQECYTKKKEIDKR